MPSAERQTPDEKANSEFGLRNSNLLRGIDRLETEAELQAKLEKSHKTGRPLRVKLGIDASGPDIHLGFAVPLRKLRQFQDAGHLAVLIIGDFTGSIGDPSGRSKTRPQLTDEQIQANMERYKEQVFKILLPDRCEFRYNSEWSKPMGGADIIKLAAKYTVARLIEREDFKKRLAAGDPIHVHELLYPLFQGYDSVAVKADIELGGADQYWNLLVGRELQREFGQEPQVVLTMPLLVGLDGVQKMSKSYGNYVGITEPPREMFGKLMSIADTMMLDYFRLCTDRPEADVAELQKRLAGGENPRNIKVELAKDVIALYHSRAAAEEAAAEFDRVFRDKQIPDEMPEFQVPAEGTNIIDLVVAAGLLPSKTEARRKLVEGAFYLDNERLTDAGLLVRVTTPAVLRFGKRRFLRLVP
ncbi:tyrosine--tRNA ligase [candidate division WOR-3 bacterium]|nr:tyrosine--tRNA ligase [candidate division WOR-3 bacterium]